jgi:hypothetical protein
MAVPPRPLILESGPRGRRALEPLGASLEGPTATARQRPHIAHVLEMGPHAPLRAALDRRFMLEGSPHDLIRREGIGPALIRHQRKRK